VLRVEGPALPLLHPPLRTHQPQSSSRPSPDSSRCISGQGAAILPLSSVSGRTARGVLNYSLVAFLPCFGLSAAEGKD
jgi:hypothetical protein